MRPPGVAGHQPQDLARRSAGGGLLCLWDLIALGTAIKDHNGPGIQQAIWQVVGGAPIIAVGVLFGSISYQAYRSQVLSGSSMLG